MKDLWAWLIGILAVTAIEAGLTGIGMIVSATIAPIPWPALPLVGGSVASIVFFFLITSRQMGFAILRFFNSRKVERLLANLK